MEKTETTVPFPAVCRKALSLMVSGMLMEIGFESADKECVESLTEMMQCLLTELGHSSRSFCEFAGRTVPVVGDVVVAMANMGVRTNGIEQFTKRENRTIIPMPAQVSQTKQTSLLQTGTKNQHPPHIPSYFPQLPDPHAYVRTPTYKQPVTEYEAIREKAATQKRDIEKALTKFLCKTSETQSLFETDDNTFPLIACKPSFPPYLAALNPTDQVFDFEELEYHYQVANRTEDAPDKDDGEGNESDNDGEGEAGEKSEKPEIKEEVNEIKPNSTTNNAILNNPNIDNPYLRAATLPKRAKVDPMYMN